MIFFQPRFPFSVGRRSIHFLKAIKVNGTSAVLKVTDRSKKEAKVIAECKIEKNFSGSRVFITTPDDIIATVVSEIEWHSGQSVIHCSGALSTDILEPAKKLGAHVGAFHPLQTFASAKQAVDNIPGSTFAIEAEEPLLTTLRDIASALNGHWIVLKASDKVLYHAAAVIACNYMVTLVKLATDLWQTFSIPTHKATQALIPLLRGTVNNIDTIGIPQCLTGPIARGDTGTIKKHLEALQKVAPALLSTYRELGLQTIPVALAKGKIDQQKAEEMKNILKKSGQTKTK